MYLWVFSTTSIFLDYWRFWRLFVQKYQEKFFCNFDEKNLNWFWDSLGSLQRSSLVIKSLFEERFHQKKEKWRTLIWKFRIYVSGTKVALKKSRSRFVIRFSDWNVGAVSVLEMNELMEGKVVDFLAVEWIGELLWIEVNYLFFWLVTYCQIKIGGLCPPKSSYPINCR